MTNVTSSPVNQAILIQRLRESVGQLCHGLAISSGIKISPNSLTTVTIHIDLCVRSWDTVAIMEASLRRYLHRLNSPSPSLPNSSPNTSAPSQPIGNGKTQWTINCASKDILCLLQVASGISLDDETTRQLSEKLSHTTPNALWQISLTPLCSKSGESEPPSS